MRIGLLRHFPVERGLPTGWVNAAELAAWQEQYDLSAPIVGPFDLGGVEWRACLSSDLERARQTATAVFPGPVEHLALLREGRFGAFPTGRLRLPSAWWRWVLRLSWYFGHPSQRAHRDDFKRRVAQAAEQLSTLPHDTLVVSHAGFMVYLSRELRRRGFSGPTLRVPDFATAYVYESDGRTDTGSRAD